MLDPQKLEAAVKKYLIQNRTPMDIGYSSKEILLVDGGNKSAFLAGARYAEAELRGDPDGISKVSKYMAEAERLELENNKLLRVIEVMKKTLVSISENYSMACDCETTAEKALAEAENIMVEKNVNNTGE